MRSVTVGCALTAVLVLGMVLSMLPVQEAFAKHDMPCNISLRTYIYDSEWRATDRKSADGQYYPGDGANILVTWSAKECTRFNIEPTETYGNVVVRSMHEERVPVGEVEPFSNITSSSPQNHFELTVVNRGTDENPRYEFKEVSTGTPGVWNVWAENDDSIERFRQAVENRCNRDPVPPLTRMGCLYGHIELDTEYRDDVCYETRDRQNKIVEICEETVSKVVFTAEGEGRRCSHGEDNSCKPFTRIRHSEKIFDIRQPNLDLILERSPFHDMFGFSVMNQDETFYIDDLMGIRHVPDMRYVKNGPIQFVLEVKQDLKPSLILNCISAKSCSGLQNHTRTDGRDYPQIYGHGKRGYHTLSVGDYSFTYTMSAYNIGTILEDIVDSNRCDGHRDRLPAKCVIKLSRIDEGRECSGNRDKDCDWREDRLLNVTKGSITIHAGPYEPVVSLYGHSIWDSPGFIPSDAQTGVTVTYDGSIEDETIYPERRMRIDDTISSAIAYNSTYALIANGTRIEPYEPFLILPGDRWLGFDSHAGNHTTIAPRTMMESVGYGTIRFDMKGLAETMVDENGWGSGIVNATGTFIPYTLDLGNREYTWLNITDYTYPRGFHSVPLIITVYDSDGMIKPSVIDVSVIAANITDRTFLEYVEKKVGEEQPDYNVTKIVGSYVALNRTMSSDTGQLVSYIPRITHVYLSDSYNPEYNSTDLDDIEITIPDYNRFYKINDTEDDEGLQLQANNTVQNTTNTNSSLVNTGINLVQGVFGLLEQLAVPGAEQIGGLYKTFSDAFDNPDADASLPFYLGLENAVSPVNITISADGVKKTWVIMETGYSQPIDLIINTEHDNDAWWGDIQGVPTMKFLPTFGTVVSINTGHTNITAFCSESCITANIVSGSNITAYNAWGGTATSTYAVGLTPAPPEYEPIPTDEILPMREIALIAIIVVTALVIVWKLVSGRWPLYN